MPLATSSLILQSTSLDLLLLPTSDALFGASDRAVSTVKIKAGTTATTVPIGTTSLTLTADNSVLIKQGTSLSFSGDATGKFRRQVIVNQDVVLGTTATTVSVNPLLRPIVSTATAIATETVGVANLRYVVNHIPLIISCSASNGATTVTTSTGDFSSVEVGDIVTGTSIPANTYVTAKASTTSLTISNAVSAAITSGNLTFTSVVAPTPLAGIQTLDLNNQETQVDTTHFGSGSGSEAAIVRFNRSYTVNGIALIGDEALETIVKRVAGFNNSFLNREVYAIATTADGEAIEGVAKIMALNFPANQNEVKKYSFTLMFQGNASWVQPYNY